MEARYVVSIDESKCTGCGNCVKPCVSQAIQIIEGKAKLVTEVYCDGFGACISQCPKHAMKLVKKECDTYSEAHVMENIANLGEKAIEEHLRHLEELGRIDY